MDFTPCVNDLSNQGKCQYWNQFLSHLHHIVAWSTNTYMKYIFQLYMLRFKNDVIIYLEHGCLIDRQSQLWI